MLKLPGTLKKNIIDIMPNNQKHRHYNILNLLGYGLAKFDTAFLYTFGFKTKMELYRYCVDIGMTDTPNAVKTRQDEFDSIMPESPRAGWHNKDGTIRKDYQDRKDFIDSFYGSLDVNDFVAVVKMTITETFGDNREQYTTSHLQTPLPFDKLLKGEREVKPRPIIQSCFKQMQITGYAAECYFLQHYQKIDKFFTAEIEDARLYGDGYDFQLTFSEQIYLAEVKGLRGGRGSIRLTKKEFDKAQEFGDNYSLIIVAGLDDVPKFIPIFNPLAELKFEQCSLQKKQTLFYKTKI